MAEVILNAFISGLARNVHVGVYGVLLSSLVVWGIMYSTKRVVDAINKRGDRTDTAIMRLSEAIRWQSSITDARLDGAFHAVDKEVGQAADKAARAQEEHLETQAQQDKMWNPMRCDDFRRKMK